MLVLTILLTSCLMPCAAGDGPPPVVVIPFDFASKFDDGHVGRVIGELFWSKLKKQGGWALPESMTDVREAAARANIAPDADTPATALKAFVRDDQAGDLAIWGRVDRVEGTALDEYEVEIVAADFRTDPPTEMVRKKARTRTVSEIPHEIVPEVLVALSGGRPVPGTKVATATDAPLPRLDAPNLVRGDFETPRPGRGAGGPIGWGPLTELITWPADPDASPPSKIIRFTIPRAVAESTGVLYYSDPFPVQEGATYRFRCRWRSTATAVKVFIKAYDHIDPQGFRGAEAATREVYRSQQNLAGAPGEWHEHAQDFTPKHDRFTPRSARVMLYAYYPPGVVEWDDVSVRLVKPPPGKDQR
jgi:hypothetical protein